MSIDANLVHHCYIILCHENSMHISFVTDFLDNPNTAFVIHLDKKSNIDMSWAKDKKNCFIVQEPVEVFWGTFSIVEATLRSLEFASQLFPYVRRFTLLSGSCFPCRSKDFIVDFFAQNNNIDFFNFEKMSTSKSKPLSRVRCIIPSFIYPNKKLVKLLSKLPLRFFSHRVKTEKLHCGSQWFSITSTTYRKMTEVLDRDYIDFFRKSYIPDESFFQTLFVGHSISQAIKPALTHADWSMGLASPEWLDISKCIELLEIKKKQNANCLFVRKVNLRTRKDYDEWVRFVDFFKY